MSSHPMLWLATLVCLGGLASTIRLLRQVPDRMTLDDRMQHHSLSRRAYIQAAGLTLFVAVLFGLGGFD